ncbi:mechanosensitive ion channel family protein [Algisphaera agarilytica]|uniref:Small conductance mechanosensitive channel n=1 Tax=Algisphaera agarilytica TaxID=1385975 RepID=A0A7X0HAZ7_9BACT|nr:mechanosensitive ion channel domain-containing protein [Algisphaera agarilytica]MBB6431080.1 small conductance mechanosensitive channel [Algisphaera agarilytica]
MSISQLFSLPLTLAQDEPPAEDAASEIEAVQASAKEDAQQALDGVMSGDVGAAWPLVEKYLLPLALAIVILIAAIIVGKIIAKIVSNSTRKANVDETLARFFGKLAFYVVVILGVIAALGRVGIEVTAFAAILAAAGFAVGMALSGTLSNFAAGVMLLIFRPFSVGDVVSAAGITAKVNEIELFTTTFDTPDNRRIIVPNSSIFGGTIENITHHTDRRVDVAVGCDYSADIDKTREVLTAAVESVGGRIDGDGRGYQVFLSGLGASSVDWAVRVWFPAADYWGKYEELTRAVKVHLDEAGIGIPFPQMDVHVDGKLGD